MRHCLTIAITAWLLLFTGNAFAQDTFDDSVARAQLTSAVENHEPVDKLEHVVVTEPVAQVAFFTEIVGRPDSKIQHLWFYQNKLMAEVNLTIGSGRWRTYSSKKIRHDWTGNWRVLVVDNQQNILAEHPFEVVAGSQQ
ncbi:hypothetical protein CWI84_07920 [Idiomarina tyrosinivorans]|uniref:DUF2914 domain-containing protein n=1 Tax=Idiomarina tyrosinivorans TaxID=1445662 RepID=A0A432ZPP5_9GAMM|nr:DUF2914 domain-containing protein [Idiomarina tyrosinivorans]RUO79879.1 hypothetical protein CWI84_07920 [Idiomarina tyrosinivorans]